MQDSCHAHLVFMWRSRDLNSGLHTCGPSTLASELSPQCWIPSLDSFLAWPRSGILSWQGRWSSPWLFTVFIINHHNGCNHVAKDYLYQCHQTSPLCHLASWQETGGHKGRAVQFPNSSKLAVLLDSLCWLTLSDHTNLLVVWPRDQKLLHQFRTYFKCGFSGPCQSAGTRNSGVQPHIRAQHTSLSSSVSWRKWPSWER